MQITKVRNKKTGRVGWLYRFTIPGTGRRTVRTYWLSEQRLAQNKFDEEMKRFEAKALNIATTDGWKTSYNDLVSQFLQNAPITSEARRKTLKRILEANELEIEVCAELNDIGGLTTRCKRLLDSKARDANYLVATLQTSLRQLSRWAWEFGLLPTHPLGRWRKMPFKFERQRRRAYSADEVRAILKAARELDAEFGRKYPLELVLRVLVTAGNRPGVMFQAKGVDLQNGRIKLPPGDGRKRNGAATLPAELIQELNSYRNGLGSEDPVLVSADGKSIDSVNFCRRDFRLAAILAFVRELWPVDDPLTNSAEPLEVAATILAGVPFKVDGRMPTDSEKLKHRQNRLDAVNGLALRMASTIKAKLAGRDLYAFVRKTHITLARSNGVHPDDVGFQVGHTASGVEGKHYMDESLFHPERSSRVVCDLISASDRDGGTKNILSVTACSEESLVTDSVVDCKNGSKTTSKKSKNNHTSRSTKVTSKESHLWDLNPGPMLYESIALPLS